MQSASALLSNLAHLKNNTIKMKITIVGKIGCSKCAKMDMILKGRGHETKLIYADKAASMTIDGKPLEITSDTHFPIYITENGVFYDFKNLTDNITIN